MAKKLKIEKIIRQRIALIEKAAPRFITSVTQTEKEVMAKLLELIGSLDTDNGIIKATKRNFALIQEIDTDLKKYFSRSSYTDAVKDFLSDMDEVKNLTDTYFTTEFGKFKAADAQRVFTTRRTQAAELLVGTSAKDQMLFKPVASTIIDAVTNQSSYKDLVKNLKTVVTGNKKVEGKIRRYARQIASDAFSTAERNYANLIAQEVGAEFVRYVGGLMDTTRCFCAERNEQYFHIMEVAEWGKGNITAGGLSAECGFPWAGMYIGTNEFTIFTYLGGYQCQHSLAAVSEFSVPLDVIQRAIDAGYYNPSETTRALLGI